jgi:hypothetical protein
MNRLLAFALVLTASSLSYADDTQPVVHVDSSSAIVVERVDDDGHSAPVCRAPCDQALDPRPRYQLAGEGMRSSNQFRLPEATAATIDVGPRSSRAFVAGIVLITVSGVLLTGGLALLGLTIAIDTGWGAFAAAFTGSGAILCGSGAIATGIPGIAILANNIQSRARVTEDRWPAALPVLTRSF